MNTEIIKNYAWHLIPASIAPLLVWFLDQTVPAQNLVFLGLIFPLNFLAARGLSTYFPKENLPSRSMPVMVEYATLQGLLFATFMALFLHFANSAPRDGVGPLLIRFLTMAMIYGGTMFAMSYFEAKKQRAEK